MHRLDTSNVSIRVETWRDEPSGIWALQRRLNIFYCVALATVELFQFQRYFCIYSLGLLLALHWTSYNLAGAYIQILGHYCNNLINNRNCSLVPLNYGINKNVIKFHYTVAINTGMSLHSENSVVQSYLVVVIWYRYKVDFSYSGGHHVWRLSRNSCIHCRQHGVSRHHRHAQRVQLHSDVVTNDARWRPQRARIRLRPADDYHIDAVDRWLRSVDCCRRRVSWSAQLWTTSADVAQRLWLSYGCRQPARRHLVGAHCVAFISYPVFNARFFSTVRYGTHRNTKVCLLFEWLELIDIWTKSELGLSRPNVKKCVISGNWNGTVNTTIV